MIEMRAAVLCCSFLSPDEKAFKNTFVEIIFAALAAFFRSNVAAREMLIKMDKFNNELEEAMELR